MGKKQYAVIAKSRAIYGNRITPEEYDSLLQKQSVAQIVAELKHTRRYGEAMKDVNELQAHRGQVELILQKTVFDAYKRLFRFAVEDRTGFGDFLIREWEIDILLNTVMFINSGEFDKIIAYIPTYLTDYTSFDLMALATVRNFDDLIRLLEGSPYQTVLRDSLPNISFRANESLQLEEFVLSLYTWHFRWQLKSIDNQYSGIMRTELRNAVIRNVRIMNWSSAYRMRVYFNRSGDEIKRLMIPIRKGLSDEAVRELLNDSRADERILGLLQNDILKIEVDKDNLETSIRESTYKYYKRQLSDSASGILVMYSLVQLMEIERQNITTIIEGVRYALPINVIDSLIVK